MRERGEVVDDLRRRRGDRGARRVRVDEVDGDAARPAAGARERRDLVARRGAGRRQVAAGEAGAAGDDDARAQDGGSRGDQVLDRAVPVGRDDRVVDRGQDVLGRVEPPLELAEHEAEQRRGARSPGRTRAPSPTAAAGRDRAGCTRSTTAVPGQVARCSASPASGPRSVAGHRQRRRDVRVDRAEQRRRWPRAGRSRPPARRRRRTPPSARAARCRRRGRRRRGGRAAAAAAQTAAAAAPARAPRRVRVAVRGMPRL